VQSLAHRHNDPVGRAAAQLLPHLPGHRLLSDQKAGMVGMGGRHHAAFGGLPHGQLGVNARASNRPHLRTIDGDLRLLGWRGIRRHKYLCPHPGPGGIGGHRRPSIA